MNTQDFINFIPSFMDKLSKDGMSKVVIDNNKWIINHFKNYCLENKIENIDIATIKEFYLRQYNFDIYETKCQLQFSIRKPLLIFLEYYNYGSYLKSHQLSDRLAVPLNYTKVFTSYQEDFVNKRNNCKKVKDRKIWVICNFFIYLNNNSIKDIKNLEISNVSEYVIFLKEQKHYSKSTINTQKSVLREALNWLYKNKIIKFSGTHAIPFIGNNPRERMLSSYTNEEVSAILNNIDTNIKYNKGIYSILTLLAYFGLRAGDIINLKFENIDFINNKITYIQHKTKQQLTLPLIDEVKYPLIDYIKNGRPDSEEKEYIFITRNGPYTKFHSTSPIYRIVTNSMSQANINYENKHHGPHALRHSLATSMIQENVPISSLSQILGHGNIKTTEIYISKDTTHLRELTLEVPEYGK